MNTPSHLLINGALLGSRPGGRLAAVAAGALAPDAPIYLFYACEKFVRDVPEALIWRRDYDVSLAQPFIDALHSFPVIVIVLGLSILLRRELLKLFSLSLLLHACEDFPLHHADAHRQFFPFGDYRFRSPVSYWDPRYHGAWGAGLELLLTAAALVVLLRRHEDRRARATWIGVWLLNLAPFLYWG